MNEEQFWVELEFRVSREMQGLEDCKRFGLWCDGFVPERCVLEDAPGKIFGRVWIGFGPEEQAPWQFKLTLSDSAAGPRNISWRKLLPPEEMTGWLEVDFADKLLKIEPGAAQPV
jgi:hypothetical protein